MAFGDMKTVIVCGEKVIADERLFGLILDYSNDRDMVEDLANQLKNTKARNCSMIPSDLQGELQFGPIRGYGYGEYAGNTAAWKLAFNAVDSRRPNWKDAEDEEIDKWFDMYGSIKHHLRASRLNDFYNSAKKRGVTDKAILDFMMANHSTDHSIEYRLETDVVRMKIEDLKEFLPEHIISTYGMNEIIASPEFFDIIKDYMTEEKYDAMKNYVSKQVLYTITDKDETVHFELWPWSDNTYSLVASNCHGWMIALVLATECHADKEKIQDLGDVQMTSVIEAFDAHNRALKKAKEMI